MTNHKCGRRVLFRRNVLLAVTGVLLIVTALEYYGTFNDQHIHLLTSDTVVQLDTVVQSDTLWSTDPAIEGIIANRKQDELTSAKWIVITSIADVTENIRRLASLEDWQIVVVGDKKSPIQWEYPNCTFLSLDSQAKLSYKIRNKLPFNSYARKTLGYLYAIDHGAKFIYDTDDDNRPLGDRLQFDFGETRSGVRVETIVNIDRPTYWNPYAHFGRQDVWPRGFPLQEIQNRETNFRLRLYSELKTSAIQQGLVDHDPDVDALYRLTQYGLGHHISFDPYAPSVQLNVGVYAPFNSQNTLFWYNAFWALYIPTSVTFRVCDIWRGYWALRLLAEIDETLAFYPANAIQYRNAHNYFKDYLDEKALYEQAHSLIDHLHAWSCKNATLAECAIDLARMMASKGYWTSEDATGIEIWFDDLRELGYNFPILRKVRPTGNNLGYNVAFVSPYQQTRHDRFKGIEKILNWCRPWVSWAEFGAKATGTEQDLEEWNQKLKTTVLIIAIDPSDHEIIPLLQTLYDYSFANIIFCSTFPQDPSYFKTVAGDALSLDKPFSYISLPKNRDLGRACAVRAVELGMNVDRYNFMSNDVLYNFWHPLDANQSNCGCQCSNATRYNIDDWLSGIQSKNREEDPGEISATKNDFTYLCRENETEAFKYYNASGHFVHSLKMNLLKKPERREEFCVGYAKDWLQAAYRSMQLVS